MENVTAKMRTTIIQNKVGDFEILRNRKNNKLVMTKLTA